MTIKLTNAGSVKPGSYILVEGVACKVADMTTSKTGKHGSAKARIVAIGLIDEKKRDIVMQSSETVEVPVIEKKSAQVLFVDGTKANVMDQENFETFDMDIPAELQGQVHENTVVLYWQILDDKVMKQIKTA